MLQRYRDVEAFEPKPVALASISEAKLLADSTFRRLANYGPRVVAECAEWLVSLPLLDSGYSGRLAGAAHLRTAPICCKLHSRCIVRP